MGKYAYMQTTTSKPAQPGELASPIQALRTIEVMDIVCALLPLGAFSLWLISLRAINLDNMTDIGLVSVFPPTLLIALFCMTSSFCLTLQRSRLRTPLLVLHFAFLIFMLYGVTAMVEAQVRFATVYRHAGYTEYIMRTGSVDPTLDAYFSWPGFFALCAFLTRLAGYHSLLAYAAWAPVFYNIIYMGPLYMIFTACTRDKRIVYLSMWLFCLTNWIGQDYLSPQGLNFFLYLVIIGILLTWFKTPANAPIPPLAPRLSRIRFAPQIYAWLRAPDAYTQPSEPRQRRLLLAVLLAVFAFVVFSHQLTPFFTILGVSALVFSGRVSVKWLPFVMAAMTAAWILIMTQTYLAGHMDQVLGGFGHLFNSLSQNVSNRVAGDPEHTFIARMRIVMTGVVWGLAALGAFLRLRRGYQDATLVLLALAPFPLFIIQPYGGEMLLRTYMFALPPMVFFIATLFYALPRAALSRRYTLAMALLCAFLLGGFLFTRYGNEHMDYMTTNEFEGVQKLYAIAPPQSLLVEGWNGTPWQFQDFEKYPLVSLSDDDTLSTAISKHDAQAIIHFMIQKKYKGANAYLIFTRSQKITFDSMSGLQPGALTQLENTISASGNFNLVYRNPDVQIFQLADTAE